MTDEFPMIEVNDLTASRSDKDLLSRIAKKVLIGENKKELGLSIALVNQAAIKELNREYRGKNKATDVLSFRYGDSGEIVICPAEVRKNAKRFDSTFNKELTKVLIHGIMHLLGHDHEKSRIKAEKMEERQNHYLKLCQKLI
jgi:probable rRNA maturation factor